MRSSSLPRCYTLWRELMDPSEQDLPLIAEALDGTALLFGLREHGQQQCHQNGDDRDDDQKLD